MSLAGVLRLAVVAAIVALALPGTAFAQNITLATQVTRTVAVHPSPYAYVISKADCEEGKDTFQFGYTLTGDISGKQIEVWVTDSSSLDCKLAADRSPTAPTHCNLVFTESSPKTMGGTLPIPTTDLARALPTVTADTCDDTNSDTLPRTLQIFFLLKGGSADDVDPTNAALYTAAQIDMLGPPAPTNVEGTAAETAITLTFKPATTTDIAGYYVYCDPPAEATSSTGGAGGAGGSAANSCPSGSSSVTTSTSSSSTASSASSTASSSSSTASSASSSSASAGGGGAGGATSSTASTSTASTSSASTASASTSTASTATGTGGAGGSGGSSDCTSSALVPGTAGNCAYICGQAGAGSAATASNLLNGTTYNVAVAAFDRVGNVGKLSGLACAAPVEVDDFFDLYRAAGGKGGNCACSTTPGGDALGFGLFTFAGLAALRRRKRGSR